MERLVGQERRQELDVGEHPLDPQTRRPKVAEFKEGEDIERFLLTFERQMTRAHIDQAEWVMALAESISGLAHDVHSDQEAEVNSETLKEAFL